MTRTKITGRKPIDQLYRAIIRYVESHKGKIVVIGGVEVQECPGDAQFNFRIAIRCTGRKPKFADKEPSL
jgi:hypothetical protein